MNREWMRERLESFKALCEAYDSEEQRTNYASTNTQEELTDQMASQLPTVREILSRLDPALVKQVGMPSSMDGVYRPLLAVQQGLGILRDRDEWAANLAPDAPSLIADQFHPQVWAAASPLWDTGQYRVAVEQAAVSLSAHIAKKATSPLSERGLVAQVFSPADPGPGQVRLHLPATNRAGHGSRAKRASTCSPKARSLGSGTWPRIPMRNGLSRWLWSTWPCCQSWPGGPKRPKSSLDRKRPASRSQRGEPSGHVMPGQRHLDARASHR